jgi:hypothetical protein
LIGIDNILGLAVVLIGAGLMILFSLLKRSRTVLRPIEAFQQLRRAIGLAVEEGKRLHVSLGRDSIIGPATAPGLIGLSTLERVAQLSRVSDRPPVATSGEGTLALLSQDTLRAVYRQGNAMDQYDPTRGRLAGVTPFSYVAGTLPVMRDEQVSANLLVGSFGPEVALLTEASDQQGTFTLAASQSLPAQAVMFATAREALIGEELFAIPAYLQAGDMYVSSLRAQDVLRWILIVVIIAGAVFKLLQALIGVA